MKPFLLTPVDAVAVSHRLAAATASIARRVRIANRAGISSRASDSSEAKPQERTVQIDLTFRKSNFWQFLASEKQSQKQGEFGLVAPDLTAVRRLEHNSCMFKVKQTDVRNFVLSYREFREVTRLTKKEADSWVKNGLIRAELAPNGRRRLYRLDSVIEGLIAKQLADFSSRTVLPTMMAAFRQHLTEEKIDLMKIPPDPAAPKILIRLYTRKSKDPAYGLRGVIAYVGRFDPRSELIGKNVYLIVDLIGVVIEAWSKIRSMLID